MENEEKANLVGEFCNSIFELRYRLRKIFQVKLREANIDISFEVLEVMKVLSKKEGIIQQEIADILFKDKSTMTYLIDNMVKAGWAVRKDDDTNRRIKLIFLTEKSRQLRDQFAPLAKDCYLALAKDINAHDIISGSAMLSKMNNSLMELIV